MQTSQKKYLENSKYFTDLGKANFKIFRVHCDLEKLQRNTEIL